MATARLQFRNDGFATITHNAGVIRIEAPTWRAKRWAVKQLKTKAKAFDISLKRQYGAWSADYQQMKEVEYRLFEALKECWVSPTSREVKSALKRQVPFVH